MAYISQELKQKLAPTIRAICQKHGIRATISVRNRSTLVLTVQSGPIDFIANYNAVGRKTAHRNHGRDWQDHTGTSLGINPYWYQEHFTDTALAFLSEVIPAMNTGNHDRSDVQTDYFDRGWYCDINIGRWNKPYTLTT
jgi:hypothetical protein